MVCIPRDNVPPTRSRVARDYLPTPTGILRMFPIAIVSSPFTLDTSVNLFCLCLKVPIMPFSTKSFHPDMKTEIFFLDQFLICFFPSCGICFSFLQRILAHQNFVGVCNLNCSHHLTTPSARLCLCRRSRQGRRRLYTFNLSLLRQRQCLLETRTSQFSQPLQHRSQPQSTLPHTTPSSSRSPSATLSTPAHTSQLGKRAGPANSHIGNNQ